MVRSAVYGAVHDGRMIALWCSLNPSKVPLTAANHEGCHASTCASMGLLFPPNIVAAAAAAAVVVVVAAVAVAVAVAVVVAAVVAVEAVVAVVAAVVILRS